MADDLIGLYRTMLAEGQASPVIQAQLAQALLDDRQYDAAIEAADIALADDPNLIAARLARASACKSLCRFNEAARDYEAVNSLVPGRWGILVNLGTTYAEMDRLGEAEACLRRAVLSEPGRKEGYANLASVYTRQEKFALAEEACRKALSLDPQLIIAHQNLAGILATTNPEKARFHRDAAFRQRQIFIEPGAPSSRPVLVLTTADASGVPLTHLLPREHYTQIRWFIDYALPDQDLDLPPHDLVFNGIGDPDFMPTLTPAVRRLLGRADPPVLNDPAQVSRTHRSELPDLLSGIPDIVVPPVSRVTDANAIHDVLCRPGLGLPVIIRPLGSHGGAGLRKVDSAEELASLARLHGGAYVTKFVDYRSEDGFYRKYRMIFVNRQPYPYHLAIGPVWLVHYWTSGMADDAVRREEERRFLADPETAIGARAMTALSRIGAKLDLDYAGIDFSVLPDGRLLVFEANATMLVHPEHEAKFAYKNQAVERILNAFHAMLVRYSRAKGEA